jgi:hypothetical protein
MSQRKAVAPRSHPIRTRKSFFRPSLELLEDRTVPSTAWDGLLGNAQHTGISSVATQPLDVIHWSTQVDYNPGDAGGAHYGSPVITPNNTVIVPFRSGADQFAVEAFNGATGNMLWSYTSDYTLPPYAWLPPYGPTLSSNGVLYFPGAGGTVYGITNPDVPGPKTPFQVPFYGSLAYYQANQAGFDASVKINTPITADNNGNIYFGYQLTGATLPAGVTGSGIARVDGNGNGTFVAANTASSDPAMSNVALSSAPALSNDGATVYVAVTGGSSSRLLGLNSTTLATQYNAQILDPRNNNPTGIISQSTATPMVAPDGTVFFGLWASSPFNGSRGFMLHFSADLSQRFTPGAFGWDDTASVVPASMVSSYHGSSSYLILTKYNNYFAGEVGSTGGNGINKIAILDPYATEIDPNNDGVANFPVMNEVLTIDGPSPDQDAINAGYPYGVREWCVNATAIDPFTKSALLNSEDGRFYRWDLTTNTLTQAIIENPIGVGEPYTSTAVGPDGTTYGINGGFLFAMGGLQNYTLNNVASAGTIAPGQTVTFTTTLASTNAGATPTGSISYYDGSTEPANLLHTANLVNGVASYSTAGLTTGSHFIIAAYSGDGNYVPGSTMLPEVVLNGTTITVTSSNGTSQFGSSVTFTATVSAPDGTPTTKVLFKDGNIVLANVDLVNGVATFTTSALTLGNHLISAVYRGEGAPQTTHIPSVASVGQTVQASTITTLSAPNTSVFGQPVTFTAVVTGPAGAGLPNGTVTFTDGANVLAAGVPLDGMGNATFNTSALSLGAHSITATFIGANFWLNSTSNQANLSVVATTTSALSVSPQTSVFGQLVTFTDVVTGPAGAGLPNGTVTFTDGATILASGIPLNGAGQAVFSTSVLGVGPHSITATFTGTNFWLDSTSNQVAQTVDSSTLTSLVSSPHATVYGQLVTFTASVTGAPGAGVPDGTVTFTDSGNVLATGVPLDGMGHAIFSTTALISGHHFVTATFTGSTGWFDSTSNQVVNTVRRAPTATRLISSLNPSPFGNLVVFTVTVVPTTPGIGIPTGTVTFKDGNRFLATLRLDDSGQVSFATSILKRGRHRITAFYSSDRNFNPSASLTITQIVTERR